MCLSISNNYIDDLKKFAGSFSDFNKLEHFEI